ncbi:MAG TPA: rhodanese-like domain-containing protein [Hanamia sp.]
MKEKTKSSKEIKSKPVKSSIIDVRRPDEFAKGHKARSINIPLQEIPNRLDEIKKIESPIVVVCGGGTRHVKAFELLKDNGIGSEKGGSWKTFDKTKSASNEK